MSNVVANVKLTASTNLLFDSMRAVQRVASIRMFGYHINDDGTPFQRLFTCFVDDDKAFTDGDVARIDDNVVAIDNATFIIIRNSDGRFTVFLDLITCPDASLNKALDVLRAQA